jgi:hypothetical protein
MMNLIRMENGSLAVKLGDRKVPVTVAKATCSTVDNPILRVRTPDGQIRLVRAGEVVSDDSLNA